LFPSEYEVRSPPRPSAADETTSWRAPGATATTHFNTTNWVSWYQKGKTFTYLLSSFASIIQYQLECGPMPNVMAALPNIGGALCRTPQSLADADYLTAVQ